MSTDETYVGEHVCVLDDDFIEATWQVGCSCGWDSMSDHMTEGDAVEAWENHCDVVFMKATWFDE